MTMSAILCRPFISTFRKGIGIDSFTFREYKTTSIKIISNVNKGPLMPAPQIILELIERFERNIESYKSNGYNETQVRREFIDPFFEALGWDVNNTAGHAEAYKDVIHEDAVKVSGVTKAPDYSFRIGGQRKFFVEAKKPSVNLKDAPAAAFQVRRYAWSAKLPLSIVTDFEEFAVYDCRIKPDQKDKSDKARITYYSWRQYADKWDEIAAVFSKDVILKGSFDKYAESSKAKRGTSEVDNAFLAEIESWRDALARNIALRNTLSVRELNDAVQRTIDRIIFLRIAEDRGIEDYGSLRSLCNGANIYGRLQELFYKADDRYNSGLFHFRNEKDQAEPPDNLTTKLTIDDKPLKEILTRLYYPDSPYEFSVLPADILGQVYEQFLGKVIRLTSDHRAVVEDKPEVKKAGGVFYTPTYIVDYIVKNTVGKLLEGKNPKTAEKLRILDPACGSGSFLLGAYQCLLDWHLQWYTENDPEKHAKAKRPILYKGYGDTWHLTTAERKRILLNNIYGVDIDTQAVEVTKLSLLLKVLEDETSDTLNRQRVLFHERALPNLGNNIKCGNSLIGPDFYDGKQMNMLDSEEAQRVNVFDWQAEFPEIFKAGGFDAVIGNPPYGALFNNEDKAYLGRKFESVVGKYDSYGFFIEKGILLLQKEGCLGFITPHTWLTVIEAEALRKYLLTNATIESLVRLPTRVFSNATVNTILAFVKKGKKLNNNKQCIRVLLLPRDIAISEIKESMGEVRHFTESSWATSEAHMFNIEVGTKEQKLVNKIKQAGVLLTELCDFCVGVQAYDSHTGQERSIIDLRIYHSTTKRDQTFRKELNGNDVSRYQIQWTEGNWISYGPWLAHPRQEYFFKGPRILVREITGSGRYRIHAAFTDEDFVNYKTILNVIIKQESRSAGYHDFFILGLLNSELLSWYFPRSSNKLVTKTFPRISILDMKRFTAPLINFSKKAERKRHDNMVRLVEQMLALNKQLAEAKTGHEQTLIQRQIDATDKQIDKLVYELYGLTEEEIAIVESK